MQLRNEVKKKENLQNLVRILTHNHMNSSQTLSYQLIEILGTDHDGSRWSVGEAATSRWVH